MRPPRSCAQPGGDPRLGDRVDGGRRVVHDQHRRLAGQRPGQRDPLALPAGERGCPRRSSCVSSAVRAACWRPRRRRPRPPPRRRSPAGPGRERDRVARFAEEVGVMRRRPASRPRTSSGSRSTTAAIAVEENSALGRIGIAAKAVQHSSVASAGSLATMPTSSPGATSRSTPERAVTTAVASRIAHRRPGRNRLGPAGARPRARRARPGIRPPTPAPAPAPRSPSRDVTADRAGTARARRRRRAPQC